ncbi:hypothetical protein RDWZM_008424 [Blomia tropicalis]|uniref:FERM domain-containing protein n=1 Tax=Blomia tropicalis TaxID=40697 RepID=A0A9Q0M1Q7_BLOTA|nr:FERM domain-containing protein 8 [Blomia tropicalis]KAJ6217267.1 hypothetical protein RDWZM_008424 [Blomia tropicalis]
MADEEAITVRLDEVQLESSENDILKIFLSDDTVEIFKNVRLSNTDKTAENILELVYKRLNTQRSTNKDEQPPYIDSEDENEEEDYDEAQRNMFIKCFGLWVCGKNLCLQLMPEHSVCQTYTTMQTMVKDMFVHESRPTKFSDQIIFCLKRNGFSDYDDCKITNKVWLKLLYHEARVNIKNNIYPLMWVHCNDDKEKDNSKKLKPKKSIDKMLDIAIIENAIEKKVNTGETDSLSDSQLNLVLTAKTVNKELKYQNSIKKHLLVRRVSKCALKRQNSNQSESSIPDYEKMTLRKLYQTYLSICQKYLDCYGGFIFEGQMERGLIDSLTHNQYYDKQIAIIINRKGLHLINLQCPKVESYEFKTLKYGILIPNTKKSLHQTFYIQNDRKKLVQIFTYHSKYIDKTIKTFVEMQTRNNNRKTNCSKSAYSPQIMAEQNRPIALESN